MQFPHHVDVLAVPDDVDALIAKLEQLSGFEQRFGMTCGPGLLLELILADLAHVRDLTDSEWISATEAARISGYSVERLRQLAIAGQVRKEDGFYRRGDVRRLREHRNIVTHAGASASGRMAPPEKENRSSLNDHLPDPDLPSHSAQTQQTYQPRRREPQPASLNPLIQRTLGAQYRRRNA